MSIRSLAKKKLLFTLIVPYGKPTKRDINGDQQLDPIASGHRGLTLGGETPNQTNRMRNLHRYINGITPVV